MKPYRARLHPVLLTLLLTAIVTIPSQAEFRIATFQADVTVPLEHALMGGGIRPAQEVVDPLLAKGIVLLGGEKPIVLVAVDWCEIRNDAYDRWREVLAEAAGTDPVRVLVASVHQHDAPVADLEAQRMLDEVGLPYALCDANFHEQSVLRVAAALKESLKNTQTVTHIGLGQAIVEKVASNRRVVSLAGKIGFPRNSSTKDPEMHKAPDGLIDPSLKTLSFWNESQPLAALSNYSVHPMSYYGKGGVSWDFPGMAREARQADTPETIQIYFSGCSGDTTAGKYNDGDPANRQALADRLENAMKKAWEMTQKHPLTRLDFRSAPLDLEPRSTKAFTEEAMKATLADGKLPVFKRNLAAMGLAWKKRHDEGRPIDVPVVDFGPAQFLLAPAEAFVAYQLDAQGVLPDSFVMVAGYGESAPGYIPSARAVEEGFITTHTWCWVSPDAPEKMNSVFEKVLKGD